MIAFAIKESSSQSLPKSRPGHEPMPYKNSLPSTSGRCDGAPTAAPGARRSPRPHLQAATWLSCVLLVSCSAGGATKAPATVTLVQVNSPYLDLQTGPGRGYPVLHSVLKGERVQVLYQRAGYVKVRTVEDIETKTVEGWVKAAALAAAQPATPPTVSHR